MALLADDIGKPALPDLVACARGCRDERARRRAAEAAIKIGGAKLIADEGKPIADEAEDEVLDRLRGRFTLSDNSGEKVIAQEMFTPAFAVRAGKVMQADSALIPPPALLAA